MQIITWIIAGTEAEYQSDPGSQKSYGVSFVNICEKIDRVVTALHFIKSDHLLVSWFCACHNSDAVMLYGKFWYD